MNFLAAWMERWSERPGEEAMAMRRTKQKVPKRVALRTQRQVLCDVMLAAGQCGTWLTLQELAQLTCYGEASISAQLRNLRKPRFGGYVLEKRPREVDEVLRGEALGTVWEYQLRRRVRIVVLRGRGPGRRSAAQRAMSLVC
jgi:hypothetical protein